MRAVDLAQRRLDGVAGVLLLLLDDHAEQPALLRLLEREERLDLDHVELGARPHHQVEDVAEEQRHRHDLERVRLEARRHDTVSILSDAPWNMYGKGKVWNDSTSNKTARASAVKKAM